MLNIQNGMNMFQILSDQTSNVCQVVDVLPAHANGMGYLAHEYLG